MGARPSTTQRNKPIASHAGVGWGERKAALHRTRLASSHSAGDRKAQQKGANRPLNTPEPYHAHYRLKPKRCQSVDTKPA